MKTKLLQAQEALMLPDATLVVDVDGTLADDITRRHLRPKADPHCLIGVTREAIEQYMAAALVEGDRPVPWAKHFVSALRSRRTLVVTARWQPLRHTTRSWLAEHYPTIRYSELLMRGARDARPSITVKLDLVLQHCRTGVWLDDDPEMLKAAERHGFVGLRAPEVYDYWREVNLCSDIR